MSIHLFNPRLNNKKIKLKMMTKTMLSDVQLRGLYIHNRVLLVPLGTFLNR